MHEHRTAYLYKLLLVVALKAETIFFGHLFRGVVLIGTGVF